MRFLKTLQHGIGYKVRNSDGDTIVEVLICLAIVAMLLGGAFTLTRSSRLGVRNSQEHTEALKIAENESEQLRSNITGDESIFAQTDDFCMYNQEPVTEPNLTNNDPTQAPASDYDPNCRQKSDGTPAPGGWEPMYLIDVSDCTSDEDCGNSIPHSHLYTITITWDQITGGTASEQMFYRLYDNGGQTAFTGQTCPGTCGSNGKNRPGATFHWKRTFTNATPLYLNGLVVSCDWDYGDGSPEDHTSCNTDNQISHIFVPTAAFLSQFPQYPTPPLTQAEKDACSSVKYEVTLTEHFSNGVNPTYQKEVDLPKCGVWNSP